MTDVYLQKIGDLATITIRLLIKKEIWEITRGMFEPNELRRFVIYDQGNEQPKWESIECSPSERQEEYKNKIRIAIGLESFEQFVFVQHFILTFDEHHYLLLWNQTALFQTIFLAIGMDPEKAKRADWLRQEREKASSRGRNYQWDAFRIKKEMDELRIGLNNAESEKPVEELKNRYIWLTNETERRVTEIEFKKRQLNDIDLEKMRTASRLESLRSEYSSEFANYLDNYSRIEMHPVIKMSVSNSICSICGTKGPEIKQTIENKFNEGRCPLCNSVVLKKEDNQAGIDLLKRIDAQIIETRKHLENSTTSKERLTIEEQKLEAELEAMRSEKEQLESMNAGLSLPDISNTEEIARSLKYKMEQYNDLMSDREKEYKERDRFQEELLSLYEELRQHYSEAQKDFVPLFRELARLFLGVDMDIRMEYSTSLSGTGPQLVVEMDGTMRRQTHQVSESQRYFLDIALRMAITKYMSDPEGKACLFIDTPEGSLDIAYEARAGEMFARFVEDGYNIIMTANINSSQILKKIASRCGKTKMALHSMMSWAPLSNVQSEEEPMFKEALEDITYRLMSGGHVESV